MSQFTDTDGEVYVSTTCPKCGTTSFISRSLQKQAFVIRDRNEKDADGKDIKLWIHCPSGHIWGYYSIDQLAERDKKATPKKPSTDPEEKKNKLIDVLMGRTEKDGEHD